MRTKGGREREKKKDQKQFGWKKMNLSKWLNKEEEEKITEKYKLTKKDEKIFLKFLYSRNWGYFKVSLHF